MPFPIGAAIGAIGSVAGSIISSRNSAASAQAVNRAQIAANKKINQQNRRLQMRTNKNQIQWLVKDANAAGIHPLAALGSSIAGNIGAPVMAAPNISAVAGDSVGQGIASGAAMLGTGIDQWLQRQQTALQNEQLMLANAQSRSQIATARADVNRAPVLKAFGLDIQRDPAKFSSGQDLTNEYGEAADVVGAISGLEAGRRALAKSGVPWIGPGQDPILNLISRVLAAYSTGVTPNINPNPGRGPGKRG